MKIGLFYGSTTCYTEIVAEKIAEIIGEELLTLHNIKDDPLDLMQNYDYLILGISTWDFGELQEDWEAQWQDIDAIALSGKTVALFGLGDQLGYSDWFLDGLGMLHEKVKAQGAQIVGYWPNCDEYEFNGSKALSQDGSQFVGLALDEDSQYDKTEDRVATWVEQVLTEFSS